MARVGYNIANESEQLVLSTTDTKVVELRSKSVFRKIIPLAVAYCIASWEQFYDVDWLDTTSTLVEDRCLLLSNSTSQAGYSPDLLERGESNFLDIPPVTRGSLPKDLLVGIELNPGPGQKRKASKMSAAKQPKSKKQKVSFNPAIMGKQASQLKFQSSLSRNVESSPARYACVLNNPFDCIPPRLGGECMMPTGTATLTSRAVYSPASGTAFSLVLYPWAQAGFLASLTTTSPYTYAVGATGLPTGYPTGPGLQVVANGARIIAAGVRIATLASATNDSGVFTIGCLPRETATITGNLTDGGFPYSGSTTATQGFNEFLNYLQTESYPVKFGCSTFYRPEDPLDFTFRNQPIVNISPPAINSELTPFFVVGASGLVTGQSYIIEQILHVEYTVSDAITGLISTGMGNLSAQGIIDTAKSVFDGKTDTSISGVEGGLKTLGQFADKVMPYAEKFVPYAGKAYRLGRDIGAFASSILN
jgi:hypothetical protein